MKKIIKILLIILFPLGILYCIGKNLFTCSGFAGFLGGLLLCGIGIIIGIYIADPSKLSFITDILSKI